MYSPYDKKGHDLDHEWDEVSLDTQYSERFKTTFVMKFFRHRVTGETLFRVFDLEDNELDFETLQPLERKGHTP